MVRQGMDSLVPWHGIIYEVSTLWDEDERNFPLPEVRPAGVLAMPAQGQRRAVQQMQEGQ